MRTFDLMSTNAAAAELAELHALASVTNMPEVTEFHPLLATDEGALICVHDTANERQSKMLLPRDWFPQADADTREEFDARTLAHLDRIAKAVFN